MQKENGLKVNNFNPEIAQLTKDKYAVLMFEQKVKLMELALEMYRLQIDNLKERGLSNVIFVPKDIVKYFRKLLREVNK